MAAVSTSRDTKQCCNWPAGTFQVTLASSKSRIHCHLTALSPSLASVGVSLISGRVGGGEGG